MPKVRAQFGAYALRVTTVSATLIDMRSEHPDMAGFYAWLQG